MLLGINDGVGGQTPRDSFLLAPGRCYIVCMGVTYIHFFALQTLRWLLARSSWQCSRTVALTTEQTLSGASVQSTRRTDGLGR
jgi:hypothetical protein